jgi:dCMP deaminase
MLEKWDERFLGIAAQIATWSKDPSIGVGAVAVNGRRQILSTGYNGFPRGVKDTEERLMHRESKYAMTVHAEMNCVLSAAYNGVSLDGATMYVHGVPVCADCAKSLVQAGVGRLVMRSRFPISDKWLESFVEYTQAMFREVGIEWVMYNFDNVEMNDTQHPLYREANTGAPLPEHLCTGHDTQERYFYQDGGAFRARP